MAKPSPILHSTPLAFICLIFLTSFTPSLSLNLTAIFSTFPDLSLFSSLVSSSAAPIAAELINRTSLTILAVPNSNLSSFLAQTRRSNLSDLSDVVRFHVLLQYLSLTDLHTIPSSGILVPTLYQTTGRAPDNCGSVNLTVDRSNGAVSIYPPSRCSSSTTPNATILRLIKTCPYNVSIYAINSLLVPSGFNLMASETRPTLGLNITQALINAHTFNVAASMLAASGVVEEFEADEGGAGITLFVPTDTAFGDMPPTVSLQSLTADRKAVVLKFHVLHSYYPLGSLESIVNPLQPTLATEDMGAGKFTLNISRVNGSVALNTGIVQATVTQTVFDQNPLSIFGISEVLLPKEIFGKDSGGAMERPSGPLMGNSPPPDISPWPASDGSPFHLSPPGSHEEVNSGAAGIIEGVQSFGIALCCIGLYLLV